MIVRQRLWRMSFLEQDIGIIAPMAIPSTIGECGRPVEKAKRTICGAFVEGVDNEDDEGVTRVDNLEKEALQ